MKRIDKEREFRLRPRKPRLARNERAGWSSGFKLLMHYARNSRKTRNRNPHGGKGRTARSYQQRCAVRVIYLNNKTRGQWKAHGRYLARESATKENDGKDAGFSREDRAVNIASQLENWQKAGDERLWKMIVSPEFGDRVDLPRLTRDLLERMAKDLGTELEWIAVEHHNTEHPHVHVVIRGLRDDGGALRMSRQYIQQGIRNIAEHLCTRQLGYRTQFDAAEAERREITEKRFTSIDRRIMREAPEVASNEGLRYFAVVRNPLQAESSETARLHVQHEAARLVVLQRMGLAESRGAGTWLVRRDFEQILRAMQRAGDRQKTLASFGALMSDERLPVEVLDLTHMTTVEGRILAHEQDEHSGRNYLMLEGTDARVYFVHYTPAMEQARSRGGLKTNSFVHVRKLFVDKRPLLEIEELGSAEALLSNRTYLRETAKESIKRGIIPEEDGWGGWLGRYQAALHRATLEEVACETRARSQTRLRQRDR